MNIRSKDAISPHTSTYCHAKWLQQSECAGKWRNPAIEFQQQPRNSYIKIGSGLPVLGSIDMSKRLFVNRWDDDYVTACSLRSHWWNTTPLSGQSEIFWTSLRFLSFHIKHLHSFTWPCAFSFCWQEKDIKNLVQRKIEHCCFIYL